MVKMSVTGTRLVHYKYGEPEAVIQKEEFSVPEPEDDEVLLEMLAAPINPVDINIIQGRYRFQPTLPNVPGYEGVGRVLKVAAGVKKLNVGDHVILYHYSGTFRTHLNVSENVLYKIPKSLGLVEGATLAVNPSTVYRMLKDYVKLEKGDTIIQNGANSSCGLIAIQICRAWGIKTVNVIRDRPEIEDLRSFLKDFGATYVLTEEEVKNTDIFKNGDVQKPKLALNCVGGQSATNIMRHLEIGGTMVTYGGMSMQHIPVPTSFLIFKDYRLVGVNIGVWVTDEANNAELNRMFEELIEMLLCGKLSAPPHVLISLDNYHEALKSTSFGKGMVGKKYILEINKTMNKL